jgi:hypothetical protein
MMKKITSIAIISLLAFSILSALVPFTVAGATITLSPTSGAPGTTVTVTGSGFASEEDVQIYFDTSLIKTVKADGDGEISTSFNVPAVAYGMHTVIALGVSSGSEATAPFYVTRLTLSQTSGYVGITLLIVNGSGFEAGKYARVYFDIDADETMDPDEIMAIAPVDANGRFQTSFTVPEAANGAHTVMAIKSSTPGSGEDTDWYASATFTVLPRIWLSPISGPSGLTVKVYGNGFSAEATNMTIFFDKDKDGVMDPDENLPKDPKTLGTTDKGTFAEEYFSFVVPTVAYDTYTVWVNDTGGVKASTTFTVGPASITLTPGTGIVGATVYITGAGFTPGNTIDVKFDTVKTLSGSDWLTGSKPTVGTDGAFSGTFWVPVLKPGAYTVNATDGSVWATAAFTVPTPVISLNRTSGPVGIPVRITGLNFANYTKGYSIKVYLKNATWSKDITPSGTDLNVTRTGAISANITIPLGTGYPYPGVYVITVNATGAEASINAAQSFEVLASSITLSKSSGTTGEWIDVVGLNFKPDDTIGFEIDTADMLTVPSAVKANATGGFTCKIQIPPDIAPGSYTITALGSSGNAGGSNKATAPFTVAGFETVILERIEDIEAKLDVGGSFYTFVNNWFLTIKGYVDDVETMLEQVKAKTDTINWADITAIKEEVSAIEGKLDVLPAWGNLVTKNWADLTGYIDSAKADIIAAMPELPPLDLSPVLNAIQGNSTAILGAIDSAKADIIAKLGTFTGTDTVASLLYEIEAKIEAGRAAQAASGSGAISVSAPIYTGTKVGTVTVSMSTSGIGVGESVAIRYYIDPANPTLYVQKTIVTNTNTLGWTDTAAAWKVEVVITGTGAVNYAYSIIYPP